MVFQWEVWRPWLRCGLLGGVLFIACGCTVLRVDSDRSGNGIRAKGLVRGHATWGFPEEDRIANLRVLGGTNRGAVAEIVIWKLFRIEAGLAGLSIGIGPLHLGLGALFYDPEPPALLEQDEECEPVEPTSEGGGRGRECSEARE